VSLRYLYRKIPQTRRICSYYRCPHKMILRNIDIDKNGRIYHHGCLMDAKDEQFQCPECWSRFDATEASFEEVQSSYNDEFKERLKPVCPHCGSHQVKVLSQKSVIYA